MSVATVDEVIARMHAIDAALPGGDGVACFNRMYLAVTESVRDHITKGSFADGDWVARLDVVFACRYFAAVDAMPGSPDSYPTAWKPLLTARTSPGIESVQFALAGMNAHINHDLPLAVVATCTERQSAPTDGTHHADYEKVNALLAAAQQKVRESFEPHDLQVVDQHVAAVANILGHWSITAAREVAWDTARALWDLRDFALATRLLCDANARTVAMASHGLLLPV